MKPIIISGAMDSEISYLIQALNAKLDQEIAGYKFYKGDYEGYPIIISKTNIGMSNSSSATTIGIMEYKPKCVINQGTAGSHSREVHRDDIVIGVESVNINSFEKNDMNFTKWKHTDFADHDNNYYEKLKCNDKLLQVFKDTTEQNVHIGVIGSGDVWNKDIPFIDHLNQTYKTLCEDMETASVYNVCKRFDIPVIGVRVISNNEILNEEYNPKASSQNYVLSKIKDVIKL